MLSANALLALGRGSRLNQANRKGITPLHVAAQKGLTTVGRWLLSQGADRSIRSAIGFDELPGRPAVGPGTPAEIARESGYEEVAELIETWGDGVSGCRVGRWRVENVLTSEDQGSTSTL